MIAENFYPTSTNINLTTNVVELTDNVVQNHNGDLSPYFIGYINYNKIPDFFIPRNLEFDEDVSPVLKIKKYSVSSSDIAYVQKNSQATNNSAINYNYDRNITPMGNNNSYYYAINAMSPLNFPVISLASGYRIRLMLNICYCFDNDRYKTATAYLPFTTISDFLSFMHGETTASVVFTNMSDTSDPDNPVTGLSYTFSDLSIADIDGIFYHDSATIGENTCVMHLSIRGFFYNRSNAWYRNDGLSTSGSNCYAVPAIKINGELHKVLYWQNSQGNRGDYAVLVHYTNSGTSQYITDISISSVGGVKIYRNYDYWLCTPIEHDNNINFDILKDNPDKITFLKSGAIVYATPAANGDFWIIPSLKASDILMYFAMFPCLSGGSANDIFLPLFDGNELTGEFFPLSELNEKGTDWQKQNDITKNNYKEQDKDVTGQGIDDKDKGTGDFLPSGGLKLIGSGGFVSYYLLGYSDLASLQSALSTVSSTFWESIGTATDTRTSNLLQYISSLKWYAIDILSGNAGIYADVTVNAINFGFDGNCTLPLAGITKLSSAVRVYDMGSVTIPYKIQNTETFLDKDPFSTVQIYLPFCGLYPVKADFVIGNTIKFYYIVDLTTGMCTALVTNDRQTLLNVSGKIGVDYCITGNDIITQSEKLAGSYLNAGVNTISGTVGLASSVMSGNIAGAAASGISLAGNIAKASIDIASSKRAVPVAIGSGSGFGSAFAHDTPCVIVNPPAVKIPDNYGHTQGYIFNESVNLSSLSDGSFVVCDNPDLSGITADKVELDLLYQILSSGFYI